MISARFLKKMPGIILCVVLFGAPLLTEAAVFGFSTKNTSISPYDTFSVDVFVNTKVEAVNAVSGVIDYNNAILEPTSIVVSDTITSWINESPSIMNNKIVFEGITFDPGFSGSKKLLFTVNFKAKRVGISEIKISEGSILKNDGFGTNIIEGFSTMQIKIIENNGMPVISLDDNLEEPLVESNVSAFPVIIDYSSVVAPGEKFFVKGVGEPNALTLIEFELISKKTIGDKIFGLIGRKRHLISDVYVINNQDGTFEYHGTSDAVPGIYRAVPFLVGQGTSSKEPGLGAQMSVLSNNKELNFVSLVNTSALFIPIILIGLISAVIYRRRSLIR